MKANMRWWHSGSLDGRPGYCFKFDFEPAIITELKSKIPWPHREWNDTTKTWWVDERFEKPLDELFPGFIEQVASQQRMF